MSAPIIEPSASSTSSSGHVDGLGRRSLSFDRTTGAILERLHLKPELAVFEQLIRHRIGRLSEIEEERFARPSSVERDPATGELMVVAEFVAGSRMSDLLETANDTAVVPGLDVALGYLLESLPALAFLHTSHRLTHGLIDPSRTVLTPEGQVVFLDVCLGPAVERLHLSPERLWRSFGISLCDADGSTRFDNAADITQVALSALMLVLGRNLRPEECPDAVPSLLMEVIEVAQIRGSSGFAGGLQRFFQRSLPLPGRRAFTSADEAVVEVRQLVRREIGVDVCRQAMIDFVEHMEAGYSTAPTHESSSYSSGAAVPELDRLLDDVEPQTHGLASQPADDTLEEAEEVELSLDQLDATSPMAGKSTTDEVYDLSSLDMIDLSPTESDLLSTRREAREELPARTWSPPEPEAEVAYEPDPAPVRDYEPEPIREPEPIPEPIVEAYRAEAPFEPFEPVAPHEPDAPTPIEPYDPVAEPEPVAEPVAAAPTIAEELEAVPAEALPAQHVETIVAAPEPAEPESDRDSGWLRRKKRHQQKSARARKDKLRSTTVVPKMPLPPPPTEMPGAQPASPSGWLVSPQRSAAFDPPVPEPAHHRPPAPQPPRPVQVPTVPSFVPTVVGPLPQPAYVPSTPTSVYGAPSTVPPRPPAPLMPAPIQPVSAPPIQVKVKANPQIGFSPPRKTAPVEPPPIAIQPERVGTMAPLTLGQRTEDAEPRAFPWKLAGIAIVVAIAAIVLGRSYLPGRTAVTGEPGAPTQTTQGPAPAPVPQEAAESGIPSGRGRLVINTQPPGIKVLMDGKPIGETPLRIDAPTGRRVLSFMTTGGEIIRSTRVSAGKTTTLDIPVFSGWVAVFAPIVLDVSENGRSIGTTEQNRLLLAPGRHELTLSNNELGYSSVHQVDIEPGAVKALNVTPRGTANLNAVPWGEVWLEGQKLGDTPLTSQVPLGVREFVFKHPRLGERRASGTIRATGTTYVSVDFGR